MTQSLPPKNLVLYADDDADDIALIREAFSDYNYAIDLLTFQDGVDLLNYVEQFTPFHPGPCLVILDINMPRKNGKEILKLFRKNTQFKDIPVVLFSTSSLPAEAAFAKKLNAGFVTKPLTDNQIQSIVEQLLAHCSEEVRKRISRR